MKQRASDFIHQLQAMSDDDRQALAGCLGYVLMIGLPPAIAILIVYLLLKIGGYL